MKLKKQGTIGFDVSDTTTATSLRNEIVSRFNSHDQLLEALKGLLIVVNKLPQGHSKERIVYVNRARTAIANAKRKAK